MAKKSNEKKELYVRFGEFNSAEEINATAVNLRREGDKESLAVLAQENGIDADMLQAFLDGDILFLCDDMAAAIGKLDVESQAMDCAEIMEDWVEYIKSRCFENAEIAKAVRSKRKSLAGAIAALLKWSFAHQHSIDQKILKEAGVSAGRCTVGIPGMAKAKSIITDYYLEK